MKIEHAVYQSAKMFGRHFDEHDEIISHITRASIDILKVRSTTLACANRCNLIDQKETFRKDVSDDEWRLIKALKAVCPIWPPIADKG